MVQTQRPVMMPSKMLLFKWLMICLPSITVSVGHSLLDHAGGGEHSGGAAQTLQANLLVTFFGLALTYIFVEILFRGIRRLQAEALAREQDVQIMSAVMEERERLSRELHDGAAQLIAHLLLRLDTIKDLVEANRAREAAVELERLHAVADEIYQDIGEAITGLRTNVTEQGLVLALQDYVNQFEERHHIHVTLQTDNTVNQLSPLAALQLFRLIQEALTNVRKHAAAQQATVTLAADGPGQLKVVIADAGRGFMPDAQRNGKSQSLGMTSMQERVGVLGGTLQVNSRPGSGTQVIAIIPIAQNKKESSYATFATPAR